MLKTYIYLWIIWKWLKYTDKKKEIEKMFIIKCECKKYKNYLIFKRSYGYEIVKDKQIITCFDKLKDCKNYIDSL